MQMIELSDRPGERLQAVVRQRERADEPALAGYEREPARHRWLARLNRVFAVWAEQGRGGAATRRDKEDVRTFALTRATFTKAKRSVAPMVAAVLLAVGVAAGLAASAPTASAATLGDTHCFASTKDGPHAGCQLDRADSVKFRGSFLAAGAAAAGTVCAALAESGPVVALCGAAAAGIAYWVSSYAPTLAPNQCIEIGVGIDSAAPYKLDAGAGYIKRINCSVE